MAQRIRMTRTTREVLSVLLDGAAGHEKLHGLEICRRGRLGTGTTYPILTRLERAGLVEAEWESEEAWQNPADGRRRPRRRLYTLTGLGRQTAEQAAEYQAGLRKVSAGHRRLRLGEAGG
jgi:DNA-binding PadR family transcriptional regulator